jgi:hypothetical protein
MWENVTDVEANDCEQLPPSGELCLSPVTTIGCFRRVMLNEFPAPVMKISRFQLAVTTETHVDVAEPLNVFGLRYHTFHLKEQIIFVTRDRPFWDLLRCFYEIDSFEFGLHLTRNMSNILMIDSKHRVEALP